MSLVEINAIEAEKKLQVVSKFPLQIISICFGVAVIFLFTMIVNLQNGFRAYIVSEGIKANAVIIENASKMTENTSVLRDIKTILIENQETIKNAKK
jgi:hypothetical protein